MFLCALTLVLCAFSAFTLASQSLLSNDDPMVVQTTSGTYRGEQSETDGTDRWLGIRYAQPPVGSLRFRAPVPYTNDSTDIIDAFEFGNACPQVPSASLGAPIGEDCLHLNVNPSEGFI